MKFKIGDKVRGIGNRYGITGKDMYQGEIIGIDEYGYVDIKILKHKNKSRIGIEYSGLNPKCFKLIEYTCEDLRKSPIGTKVTYEDGKVFIKIGMNTYSKEISTCISEVRNYDDMFKDRIIKVEEPKYSTFYERKEEILDKVEKRYLSNIIRPFKENVRFITKRRYWIDSTEYNDISICIRNNSNIVLPKFIANKMYKGMKMEKSYTLEELGI